MSTVFFKLAEPGAEELPVLPENDAMDLKYWLNLKPVDAFVAAGAEMRRS